MWFDDEYKTFVLKNCDLPDVTSAYKLVVDVPMNPAEEQGAITRNIACEYNYASSKNNVADTFKYMLAAVLMMNDHADFQKSCRGAPVLPYVTNFLNFINDNLQTAVDITLAENTAESLANTILLVKPLKDLFSTDYRDDIGNVENFVSIQNAIVEAALKLDKKEYAVAIMHGFYAGELLSSFVPYIEKPKLRNLQEAVVRNFINTAEAAENERPDIAKEAAKLAFKFSNTHPNYSLIAEAELLKIRLVNAPNPDRHDEVLCRKPATAPDSGPRQ